MNGSGCSSTADIIGLAEREHASRADMVARFFNTTAFAQPAAGTHGSSGRGILTGPALVNTDFAVLKDFVVREGYRFQFRTEFFNLFNQVNFNNPITVLTNGQFGQIRGARAGRTVQLGLKFLW